jgi:hypothetical protein
MSLDTMDVIRRHKHPSASREIRRPPGTHLFAHKEMIMSSRTRVHVRAAAHEVGGTQRPGPR